MADEYWQVNGLVIRPRPFDGPHGVIEIHGTDANDSEIEAAIPVSYEQSLTLIQHLHDARRAIEAARKMPPAYSLHQPLAAGGVP